MKTPFGKNAAQRSRADAGHAGVSANMMKKKNSHNGMTESDFQECDLKPHTNVARNGFAKIGFHVVC
uniref:Uncharacterized protein n=1 Tax=Sinocyclocheilus anshuiensis TaxID=1608454 RepID=A0A671N5J4_9TELE